jgi:hypothetical protein
VLHHASRMFDRPSDSYPLSNRTPAEWKVDSDIQYSQASSRWPRVKDDHIFKIAQCASWRKAVLNESNRLGRYGSNLPRTE